MFFILKKLLVYIVQFLFGAVFMLGGLMKCIDPMGTALKIKDYMTHFGVYDLMVNYLADLSMGMAWCLALLEFAIGASVIYGHNLKRYLTFGTILMVFFTPLTLYLALTDAIPDCGCFGDAVHLTNWQTFFKNIALDAALVLMWVKNRDMYQLTGLTRFVIVFYVMIIGLFVLLVMGTWRLPVVDFRPYKPGVSLRFEDNPDAPDFFVTDIDSNSDMTSEILADSSYTYLIISPLLNHASMHDLDKIEALAEWTQEEWYGFYLVTGSDQAQIDNWRYNTGAQYPILLSDVQLLEMMIRANPGIIVLHDGKILSKSAEFDIERLQNPQLSEEIDYKKRLFYIIILFFAPILLSLLRIFVKKTVLFMLFGKHRKV